MKVLVCSVACALIPLILWRFLKWRTAGTASRDSLREDDRQRFNRVKPKPLTSNIYELSSPISAESITLDIFFFHGLQQESSSDAHVSTWRSEPGEDASEVIWPQEWLAAKYPQARIMTVTYDASIKTTPTKGRMDLHLLGEALLVEILQVRKEPANKYPIILVGHSFGGLVIKQLCTYARHRELRVPDHDVSPFLNYVRGFLFYGTPHRGMKIPRRWVDPIRNARNEPLLKFVPELNKEAGRLHEMFEEDCGNYQWKIYSVNESHASSEGEQLVSNASARYGNNNVSVSSDHYSVCRPASEECTKYTQLCKLIDQIQTSKKVFEDSSSRLDSQPFLDKSSKKELLERVEQQFQKYPCFGIAGMPGSGKTAMAKLVGKDFEKDPGNECVPLAPVPDSEAAFVADVERHLGRCKKLLVILDDIPVLDHMGADKLKQLAGSTGRIQFIATSCDMRRFRTLKWRKFSSIWNVPLLKFEAAKMLFCSNAFPQGRKPPDHLKELIDKVVQGCAGLPLCLEAAGLYLEGREDRGIWELIERALREADDDVTPLEGVWKKLKASINSSRVEEKEMFLDAAHLLLSEDSPFSYDEFLTTWNSMYEKKAELHWETLQDRFLVQKVEKKVEPEVVGPREVTERAETSKIEYQVHDHLKAIGTKIARERCIDVTVPPGGRPATGHTSHLGKIVALRAEVKSNGSSFEAPVEEVNDTCCGWKNQTRFDTPESARYLTLKVPRVCRKCNAKGGMRLPRGLRMLQWTGSTSNIIKLDQQWETLVVLKLKRNDDCCLDILSPEMCTYLSDLRLLSLKSNDTSLLGSGLAKLHQLRYLEIQCEILKSLPDFGCLSKLESLCLKECHNLKSWPDGMDFQSLTNLQTLRLESCHKLETLPSKFPSSLKRLSVTHCLKLSSLPAGIGDLSNLETLNLDSCSMLQSLPDRFGGLSKLQTLTLSHCKKLESLPESFGELSSLSSLWLDNCTQLQTLGRNFWNLASANLKYLNIKLCNSLPDPPVPDNLNRSLKVVR